MAELNTTSNDRHKKRSGVKKSKKLSTRVDLTPMVDLGFLLITFFIFTTTMSRPKAMHLLLPKDSADSMLLRNSGALTLIPTGDDQLFYYEGGDPGKMQSSSFRSLREIIHDKKIRTNPTDFMVIIKPTKKCSYKNTIATLDEITINQVRSYALVELSKPESDRIDLMGNR
jgi:biopolymer transport protein ExbD